MTGKTDRLRAVGNKDYLRIIPHYFCKCHPEIGLQFPNHFVRIGF